VENRHVEVCGGTWDRGQWNHDRCYGQGRPEPERFIVIPRVRLRHKWCQMPPIKQVYWSLIQMKTRGNS